MVVSACERDNHMLLLNIGQGLDRLFHAKSHPNPRHFHAPIRLRPKVYFGAPDELCCTATSSLRSLTSTVYTHSHTRRIRNHPTSSLSRSIPTTTMAGLANLIPLIILFVVVGGGGYIGYQIYLWSNEVTDRGKKHMEKKNMTFTKDGGLKVGVKEVNDEKYTDKTQKYACSFSPG